MREKNLRACNNPLIFVLGYSHRNIQRASESLCGIGLKKWFWKFPEKVRPGTKSHNFSRRWIIFRFKNTSTFGPLKKSWCQSQKVFDFTSVNVGCDVGCPVAVQPRPVVHCKSLGWRSLRSSFVSEHYPQVYRSPAIIIAQGASGFGKSSCSSFSDVYALKNATFWTAAPPPCSWVEPKLPVGSIGEA